MTWRGALGTRAAIVAIGVVSAVLSGTWLVVTVVLLLVMPADDAELSPCLVRMLGATAVLGLSLALILARPRRDGGWGR